MDWKTNKVDYYLEAAQRPENRPFFARIASRLLELGRPEEAVALCSENVGRSAGYLSALLVLGEGYLALEDYDKAKEVLNAALKQDPDNLRALYLLGQTAQRAGEILLAYSFYERVLEADPYCEEASLEAEKLKHEIESREFAPPSRPAKIADKVELTVSVGELEEATLEFQQEKPKPERVRPARKEPGEFMEAKEIGVDTPLVGIDLSLVEKAAEPVPSSPAAVSPRDLEPAPAPKPEPPAPAPSAPAAPKPLFETASIAEIYAKQGLFELALRVYQKLLNANPDEALYKTKIAELEQKIREQRAG
ncbi:MAG: tetratricopeptide repeat protein [candidate division Zixibacteria bacterium]|nr:tetratricopeptide repeat protein [candidate division Zixibacteria bacterium]